MTDRRRGVSLIELLVAVAVVAALVGLLLPAVQKVRASAARIACHDRLRQQGLAVLGYEAAKGRLPPGGVAGPFDPVGAPDGSVHGLWAVVRGQLGEDRPYTFAVSWDHPDNAAAVAGRVAAVECPSTPDAPTAGGPLIVNSFLADLLGLPSSAGCEGPLPVNGRVRLTDITDGAANTILVVPGCGRAGLAWAAPETSVPVRELPGVAAHGGIGLGMADGSVRQVRADTPLAVLAALATRAGGEAVGE